MKINALNDAALAAASLAATKAERGTPSAGARAPEAAGAPSAGVPVTVSSAARSLDVASAGSGIDETKVASVKKAIADGTFNVNAGAIADKLLSNAQEVLSRVRN